MNTKFYVHRIETIKVIYTVKKNYLFLYDAPKRPR